MTLVDASRRRQAIAALAFAGLLALPPLRAALESGMAAHMLVQYPALMLAGALFARTLTPQARRTLAAWNGMGISGLVFAALVLAVLMIPRVLDLVLVDSAADALKWAALIACGAALTLSWRPAGTVVQAFFLGNLLPMTAAVGLLYQEAPLQLCSAYRIDEQQAVGAVLVWLALFAGLAWLLHAFALPRRAPAPVSHTR